jgi:hypothetical protein
MCSWRRGGSVAIPGRNLTVHSLFTHIYQVNPFKLTLLILHVSQLNYVRAVITSKHRKH